MKAIVQVIGFVGSSFVIGSISLFLLSTLIHFAEWFRDLVAPTRAGVEALTFMLCAGALVLAVRWLDKNWRSVIAWLKQPI